MLHGNPLLRGWQLSDVSFYTTELPQYMLVERLRGLTPDVVHVAAAMTYALLVLSAALLAKGKAVGGQAWVRISITAGIMLAPQPGTGVSVLMLSPDHVGTVVPVLLTWILLDRAPRRWYLPVAIAALLSWALIADTIVLIIAVLPLAATCAARAYQASVRQRLPLRDSWFELSLAAAAVAAVGIAESAVALIRSHGGYAVWPVGDQLASFGQLPHNLMLTIQGLLVLFGADFFGHHLGYAAVLAMLHLVGLALAGWGLCAAVRRFVDQDIVVQVLAAGAALTLAAYLCGQRAQDINSTREISAVLPFTAILAGRLLAERLDRARLLPAFAVVLTACVLSLGNVAVQPSSPARNQRLTAWLAAHRLYYGLAGYWEASSVTLDSGGRVRIRPIRAVGGQVKAGYWEMQRSWYSPAMHDANFLVLAPREPGRDPFPWGADVRATFGQPARIYNLGHYTVLVWNFNLLTRLGSS